MLDAVPAHVFVIGGGRWARVYLGVLNELLPAHATMSVHTARGVEVMTGWVVERGLAGRIEVTAEKLQPRARAVAIIANAAADHAAAASRALECGIPVLLEKPLALNFAEAFRLVEWARMREAILAPSQVFLFTRYLENFASRLCAAGRLNSLALKWVDPKIEIRHGEAKRFDAGLPIQADVLPHIVPVIEMLTGILPEAGGARLGRDGLALNMTLTAGGVPCALHLERAGAARSRVIEAMTENGSVRLDFSSEPGTIWQADVSTDADPDWARAPRPLARMLAAFFKLALANVPDERFGTAAALKAMALSDFATSHP